MCSTCKMYKSRLSNKCAPFANSIRPNCKLSSSKVQIVLVQIANCISHLSNLKINQSIKGLREGVRASLFVLKSQAVLVCLKRKMYLSKSLDVSFKQVNVFVKVANSFFISFVQIANYNSNCQIKLS